MNVMSTRVLLSLIAVSSIGSLAAQNTAFPEEHHELFMLLRKTPMEGVVLNGDHVDVVNARYEPCTRKKDARYLRVINRMENGLFLERVITPDGRILMQGTVTDERGRVPQGHFTYYDETGSLRAEDAYMNGRKGASGIATMPMEKCSPTRNMTGWTGTQSK